MLGILKNKTYARLFLAQVVALLGTGLLTIALGLLAFDLAGEKAGAVLGTAYAIKMLAYVGLAPIASALVARLPRKSVLIGADIVRAGIALLLPFIDTVWQIYLLIFVLQAASATFTPVFQSAIPDILPKEKDYIYALSLSRLAYDLENLISPALAALLLMVISFHWLFSGTALGFAGSALLVLMTSLPLARRDKKARSFIHRLTRGTKIYFATPRLRGLLALNFSAAALGAFILVNTIVFVRVEYGSTQAHLAYALAAYGAGSMAAALALPAMMEKIAARTFMVGAALLAALLTLGHALFLTTTGLLPWAGFLAAWAVSGALYSAVLTPSGQLLRRSAHSQDRSALFAAQFSLSHACWLLTYPIAGWAGVAVGLPATMIILGLMALLGAVVAVFVWPRTENAELVHEHANLPHDHPHLQEFEASGRSHRHIFIIDDEHHAWPTQG